MADGNNQGKALLRILQGSMQTIDAPSDERQDTSTFQEFPTGTSFPSALPTTHVRGAAAGEQQEDAQRFPTVSCIGEPPYPLPRPGASAAVPVRSSGADLLRRLQGTPKSPAPTITCQRQQPRHQNQHWHVQQQYQHNQPPPPGLAPPEAPQQYHQHQQQYHQHQHQYQHQYNHHHQQQQQLQHQYAALPAPPPVTPRSIAAEQERFLKKFLSIESPETESRSAKFSPAPPLSPAPSLPTSAEKSTAAARESGGGREGDGRSGRSRAKERGKGRGQRGGRARGGVGGGGGIEDGAVTSSTPKREPSKRSVSSGRRNTEASSRGKGGHKGRGARSHNEFGSRESKKGWRGGGTRNGGGGGGGGGGGRGGGRSKALSPSLPPPPAYAWSSFQNSPDPKNIPIPSLSHLSLSSDVSAGDEGPGLEETVTICRDDMVVEEEVIHTPPPPPPPPPPQLAEGGARTAGETRSAAKRAEDDIKRMLRLG